MEGAADSSLPSCSRASVGRVECPNSCTVYIFPPYMGLSFPKSNVSAVALLLYHPRHWTPFPSFSHYWIAACCVTFDLLLCVFCLFKLSIRPGRERYSLWLPLLPQSIQCTASNSIILRNPLAPNLEKYWAFRQRETDAACARSRTQREEHRL